MVPTDTGTWTHAHLARYSKCLGMEKDEQRKRQTPLRNITIQDKLIPQRFRCEVHCQLGF